MILPICPEDKKQKGSSDSEDAILKAFNMAEGLAVKVDLICLNYPNPINSI